MENAEIIKKYSSSFARTKEKYFFLNLSDEEYENIIYKAIDTSKEELEDKEELSLDEYLKENLEVLLREETTKAFLNDAIEILSNYFKTLEVDISSYEAFSSSLIKFFAFLNNYNVSLKSSDVDYLLQNNHQAYLFAKGIYEYLKEIKLTNLSKELNLNTILLSYYLVYENSLDITESIKEEDIYSKEEVRKMFASLISSIKEKFAFLKLDDIDDLVDKALDESLAEAKDAKDNFNNVLTQHLEKNFMVLSSQAFQKRLNETLESYFNYLKIDISNYQTFIINLKEILYFFKKNNVNLKNAAIDTLIANNTKARLLASSLYEYLDQIKKSSVYSDYNLRALLGAYHFAYKDTLISSDIKGKNLYEFYENYTKDEVNKALKMLSNEEIILIRKMYANDGSYLENGIFYKEIDKLLKKVIPKYLEEVIKKEKADVIYRLFSKIDKSLIDIALKRLPLSYQNKIEDLKNLYYQKDKEMIFSNNDFNIEIYPRLLNIITKLTDNSLNIYCTKESLKEIFNGYTEAQIRRIISYLPQQERLLLFLKYSLKTLKVREDFVELNAENEKKLDELINKKMLALLQKEKETAHQTITEKINEYPKEKIKKVVDELSKESQELFYLIYDKDFNIKKDYASLDYGIKKKIYNLLNLVIIKLNRGNEIQSYRGIKNFYQKLGKYSKKEVDVAISCLSPKYQSIYHLYYDENGDALESYYTADKNTKIMVQALRSKVEYYIISKNGPKNSHQSQETENLNTIYQFFGNYPKEEVDTAIKKLTPQEIETFHLRFDESGTEKSSYQDLDTKTKNYNYQLIKKLKRLVENMSNFPVKNLYNRFKGFSKKEIDLTISMLPAADQQFLASLYNQEGERIITTLDSSKYKKLYSIISKLNTKLKNKKEKSKNNNFKLENFYMNFKGYNKEQINDVKSKLPISYQELLNYIYDKNGNPRISTSNLKVETKQAIDFVIKNINATLEQQRNEYNKKLIYFIKTNRVLNEINNFLNNDFVTIIVMKYGHLEKNYNNEEIAKTTNYSLEEIKKLNQLFLKIYETPKIGYDNNLISNFGEILKTAEDDNKLVKTKK